MRVRIVRPLPSQIEGIDLDPNRFRFGAAYDIGAPLCEVLLLRGYAVPDDVRDTADDAPRRRRKRRRLSR
jgi:hypothetical protein